MVPTMVYQFVEGFHVFGIYIFFMLLTLLSNLSLRDAMRTTSLWSLMFFISLLSDLFIFARGTVQHFLFHIYYDLLGIVFVYLLSRFIDALTNTLKKMMLRNKSCCLQDKYI